MTSTYPTAVIPQGAWVERAACASHAHPDWWFATNTRSLLEAENAKQVCRRCPVRAACLDDAIRRGDPDSIAGGLTPAERRQYVADREMEPSPAVKQYLSGEHADITNEERLEAICRWAQLGRSQSELDALHGLRPGSTRAFLYQMRVRYAQAGRPFPDVQWVKVNRCAGLSEEQVVEIRLRSAGGESDRKIAVAFGVAHQTITAVVTGQRYTQYGGPLRRKSSAVSGEQVRECADKPRSVMTSNEIGAAA